MKLAFYIHMPKITRPKRWLVSRIVKIFAGNKGSDWQRNITHVELVFSNGDSFSSSSFDDGARFKKIDYQKHPERWKIFEIDPFGGRNVEAEEQVLKYFCQDYVGKKYDFWGVIWYFGFNKRKDRLQNNNKWWCSEIIAWVLGETSFRISPYELYRRTQ